MGKTFEGECRLLQGRYERGEVEYALPVTYIDLVNIYVFDGISTFASIHRLRSTFVAQRHTLPPPRQAYWHAQPRKHENVVHRRARPHPHTSPTASFEPSPAARAAVKVGRAQNPRELQPSERYASVVRQALRICEPGEREEEHGGEGEGGEDAAGIETEEKSGGADANFDVVVLVLGEMYVRMLMSV